VSLQNSGNGEIQSRKQEITLTRPLPLPPTFANDALIADLESVEHESSQSKCSESAHSSASNIEDRRDDQPPNFNPPVLNQFSRLFKSHSNQNDENYGNDEDLHGQFIDESNEL